MKLWRYSQINVYSPKSHCKTELYKPVFLSQLDIEYLTNIMNKHCNRAQQRFPKEEVICISRFSLHLKFKQTLNLSKDCSHLTTFSDFETSYKLSSYYSKTQNLPPLIKMSRHWWSFQESFTLVGFNIKLDVPFLWNVCALLIWLI